MELKYHMASMVHTRMEQHRGRKVSFVKVSKAMDAYFGRFPDAPFERLFEGCPTPWQVRVTWPGPEAEGLEAVEWCENRASALGLVVSRVDSHRLYPTDIQAHGDTLVLIKDGASLMEICPLEFHAPDPIIVAAIRSVVDSSIPGDELDIIRALAQVEGLAQLKSPVIETPTWGYLEAEGPQSDLQPDTTIGSIGLFGFEPVLAAQRLNALYAAQNIHVGLDVAREDLAYFLGFDGWPALLDGWQSLGAFEPVRVKDHRDGRQYLCRDGVHALATMTELSKDLGNQYTWSLVIQLDTHAAVFRNQVSREHDAPRKVAISFKSNGYSGWHRTKHINEEPVDTCTARDTLCAILGTGRNVEDQLQLTNSRRGVTTIQAGNVLLSHFPGEPYTDSNRISGECLYCEVLKSDGWRDVPSEHLALVEPVCHWRKWRMPYEAHRGWAVRTKGIPALGMTHQKKRSTDFYPEVFLRGATTQELRELDRFLGGLVPDKSNPTLLIWTDKHIPLTYADIGLSFTAGFGNYKTFPERLKERQRANRRLEVPHLRLVS